MEIELEFQKHSPNLEKLIHAVDRPGGYCTGGKLPCPLPALLVDGVGIVSFPTPEFQVDQLIAVAQQAPYGKGSETIVDTAVRNCWEISPKKMSLGGNTWDDTLNKLVYEAAIGLGCEPGRMNAELYKLLIYEKGGFFLPHQDTEKSPGMIATLTLSLPVMGSGGELIVCHKQNEQIFDLNVQDPSELAYAAFYADCQHEIKKVTSGHRISLVFNLCVSPSDNETIRKAPDYTEKVDEIAVELARWCGDEKSSSKLVWILEHQYSESGLAFSALKNGDRAVAYALREAVKQVPECELYAGIVCIDQMYDAWEDEGYHGYASTYSASDFGLDSLIESTIKIDDWTAVDDSKPKFGSMWIDNGELMPDGILDFVDDPDDEEYEGYTGNAGATVNLIYNLAALALFKRQQMIEMLTSQGSSQAVAWINEEIRQNGGKTSERIHKFAKDLVEQWVTALVYWRQSASQEMLKALAVIGDVNLSKEFIHSTAIREYEGSENPQLIKVLLSLDSDDACHAVMSLIQEKFTRYPDGLLDLLVRMEKRIGKWGGKKSTFLQRCANDIVQQLPDCLSRMRASEKEDDYWEGQCSVNPQTIQLLFTLVQKSEAGDAAQSAVELLAAWHQVNFLDRVLPKALEKLQNDSAFELSDAFSDLWQASTGYLLRRSEYPPQPPQDWKRNAQVDCDCEYCQPLITFCLNPNEQYARFSVKRELRSHLRSSINRSKLDIDYQTDSRGSPYTLVLAKNQASYKERLKQYAEDIKYFDLLKNILPTQMHPHDKEEYTARILSAVDRVAD